MMMTMNVLVHDHLSVVKKTSSMFSNENLVLMDDDDDRCCSSEDIASECTLNVSLLTSTPLLCDLLLR